MNNTPLLVETDVGYLIKQLVGTQSIPHVIETSRVMSSAASRPENADLLTSEGAIQHVLNMLPRFDDNAVVLCELLRILMHTSVGSEACRNELSAHTNAQTLVRLLENHSDKPDIVAQMCRLIRNLAVGDGSRWPFQQLESAKRLLQHGMLGVLQRCQHSKHAADFNADLLHAAIDSLSPPKQVINRQVPQEAQEYVDPAAPLETTPSGVDPAYRHVLKKWDDFEAHAHMRKREKKALEDEYKGDGKELLKKGTHRSRDGTPDTAATAGGGNTSKTGTSAAAGGERSLFRLQRLNSLPILQQEAIAVDVDLINTQDYELVAGILQTIHDKASGTQEIVGALTELAELTQANVIICKLVARMGGAAVLSNCLHRYVVFLPIIKSTCVCLLNLATAHPLCAELVTCRSAVPYIINALYNRLHNEEVVDLISRIITIACSSNLNKAQQFVERRARVLLTSIDRPTAHILAGLEALRDGGFDPDVEVTDDDVADDPNHGPLEINMADPNSMRLVVKSVWHQLENYNVVLNAAALLFRASTEHPHTDIWTVLMDEGGVVCLLQMLKTYYGCREVTGVVLRTIGNIASDTVLRQELGTNDGIELLLETMMKIKLEPLVELCLWCLSVAVEDNTTNQNKLFACNAINTVLNDMADPGPSALQLRRAHLLSAAIFENPELQIELVNIGIRPILVCMQVYDDLAIHQQCAALLANATEPPVSRTALINAGAAETLLRTWWLFKEDESIKANCTQALEALLNSPSCPNELALSITKAIATDADRELKPDPEEGHVAKPPQEPSMRDTHSDSESFAPGRQKAAPGGGAVPYVLPAKVIPPMPDVESPQYRQEGHMPKYKQDGVVSEYERFLEEEKKKRETEEAKWDRILNAGKKLGVEKDREREQHQQLAAESYSRLQTKLVGELSRELLFETRKDKFMEKKRQEYLYKRYKAAALIQKRYRGFYVRSWVRPTIERRMLQWREFKQRELIEKTEKEAFLFATGQWSKADINLKMELEKELQLAELEILRAERYAQTKRQEDIEKEKQKQAKFKSVQYPKPSEREIANRMNESKVRTERFIVQGNQSAANATSLQQDLLQEAHQKEMRRLEQMRQQMEAEKQALWVKLRADGTINPTLAPVVFRGIEENNISSQYARHFSSIRIQKVFRGWMARRHVLRMMMSLQEDEMMDERAFNKILQKKLGVVAASPSKTFGQQQQLQQQQAPPQPVQQPYRAQTLDQFAATSQGVIAIPGQHHMAMPHQPPTAAGIVTAMPPIDVEGYDFVGGMSHPSPPVGGIPPQPQDVSGNNTLNTNYSNNHHGWEGDPIDYPPTPEQHPYYQQPALNNNLYNSTYQHPSYLDESVNYPLTHNKLFADSSIQGSDGLPVGPLGPLGFPSNKLNERTNYYTPYNNLLQQPPPFMPTPFHNNKSPFYAFQGKSGTPEKAVMPILVPLESDGKINPNSLQKILAAQQQLMGPFKQHNHKNGAGMHKYNTKPLKGLPDSPNIAQLAFPVNTTSTLHDTHSAVKPSITTTTRPDSGPKFDETFHSHYSDGSMSAPIMPLRNSLMAAAPPPPDDETPHNNNTTQRQSPDRRITPKSTGVNERSGTPGGSLDLEEVKHNVAALTGSLAHVESNLMNKLSGTATGNNEAPLVRLHSSAPNTATKRRPGSGDNTDTTGLPPLRNPPRSAGTKAYSKKAMSYGNVKYNYNQTSAARPW